MEFFSVRDGVRKLEFNGIKLAESSSRLPRKPRWVEFSVYRTPKGQYVVSRIGFSLFYHSAECYTVTRNGLAAADGQDLSSDYIACDNCRPDRAPADGLVPVDGAKDEVYPETPRFAAWVCTDALGVVSSLMKEDDNGTEYLTNVARRLLMLAAEKDEKIADAFYVDRIE